VHHFDAEAGAMPPFLKKQVTLSSRASNFVTQDSMAKFAKCQPEKIRNSIKNNLGDVGRGIFFSACFSV
jgi:hypothetical protein